MGNFWKNILKWCEFIPAVILVWVEALSPLYTSCRTAVEETKKLYKFIVIGKKSESEGK